ETFAREIERYEKTVGARDAEAKRVRDRLTKEDIVLGVRKGYALLEPCLKVAREQAKLAVGIDTLVLTWKIRKDGTAYSARLEGPTSMLVSDPAECVEQAVGRWRFPHYS